jgi:hypothetical protein
MLPRLKVKLHQGWIPVANPNGPATYVRGSGPNPPALQFSIAQHKPGALPNVTPESLVGICERMTEKVRGRRSISKSSGECTFGKYGTVIAKGDAPAHVQIWVLSNEREFILVTHTCEIDPEPKEDEEANQIALLTSCE